MNKIYRKLIFITFFIVSIIIIGYFFFSRDSSSNLIDNSSNENSNNKESKTIPLRIYDKKTNCSLNGEVYLNYNPIGNTSNGKLILKEDLVSYNSSNNDTFMIKGLTDLCFNQDSNLPFLEIWEISNLKDYFDNNWELALEAGLTPRSPRYYGEMQGFVRPEEAREYLKKDFSSSFENKTWPDLDRIAKYMQLSYISDWNYFQSFEYWQTPAETIKNHMGDCEDWATATLSLMRAYNDSIDCYNIVWQTHISILCYSQRNFVIYDQDKTRFSTYLEIKEKEDLGSRQEDEVNIRRMRNNYFESYGISPSERKMYALFNEKELITFENDEDFVDWAVDLVTKNN